MDDKNDYDRFAVAYSDDTEKNAFNAYYERPASLHLMGDVAGLRVLDAGCGGGAHAAALIAGGATVTGLDKSRGMLAVARKRLGVAVALFEADLNTPLRFEDGAFDGVLASLVMHYMRDWTLPLAEFRRVLVPGGRLVISTHHPFRDHVLARGTDYFATYRLTDRWEKSGQVMMMEFWHRPLQAMTDALTDAGFVIDRIAEPQPDPRARELFPEDYRLLTTEPQFIFFAAHRT